MKYCTKCGNPMEDDMLFCQRCGLKDSVSQTEHNVRIDTTDYGKTDYVKTESPRIMKLIKNFAISIIILVLIITIVSIGIAVSNRGSSTSNVDIANNSSKQDNALAKPLFSDVIFDEALRLDFIRACEQIGMSKDNIKNLKQVDDWVGGKRYSFTYSGSSFRLYCNMDSTVNSIKLGVDTDIYKQGFEPYQVSDYIVNPSIVSDLQVMTEDYVKSKLNYPATAKFPRFDWSYGRERNLYFVSSHVTAKNAFGVEDNLSFSLTYQVDGSSANLVYFELDGSILVNKMDTIPVPERKKLEAEKADSSSDKKTIVLKEGELGEYGRTVTLDGSDYINYYVPVGTYTITNKGKWCKVYLAKDAYFTNSDGYKENEVVKTIEFSNYGETQTIVIGSGEHLELTLYAMVTLTAID